jgi:hypothetical protein
MLKVPNHPEKPLQMTKTELMLWGTLAGAIFFAELSLTLTVDMGQVKPFPAIVAHGFIALTVLLLLFMMQEERKDCRIPQLLAFLLPVFGPIGAFAVAVIVPFYAFYRRKAAPFEEWFAELFPEERMQASDAIYERIQFGLDYIPKKAETHPFHDVLEYAPFQQKQTMLAKINRYFRPEFTPVLGKALNNEDNSIRVQAASVLANIDNRFMALYIKLERESAATPGEFMPMMALARHCELYAKAGILSKDAASKKRQQALELYCKCLELRPENQELKAAIARIHLENKEPFKAYSYLKKCIEENSATPSIYLCYMEILFQMKAFKRLRALAASPVFQFHENEEDRQAQEVMNILAQWINPMADKKPTGMPQWLIIAQKRMSA